jgi:hypothetical protein
VRAPNPNTSVALVGLISAAWQIAYESAVGTGCDFPAEVAGAVIRLPGLRKAAKSADLVQLASRVAAECNACCDACTVSSDPNHRGEGRSDPPRLHEE